MSSINYLHTFYSWKMKLHAYIFVPVPCQEQAELISEEFTRGRIFENRQYVVETQYLKLLVRCSSPASLLFDIPLIPRSILDFASLHFGYRSNTGSEALAVAPFLLSAPSSKADRRGKM